MKTFNKTSRSVIATLLAGGALLAAGGAYAQDRVIVENHGPAVYGEPHPMPVGVSINIGWHGDRYYDGHRYWNHDDWMRRHPHDHDPRHDDRRDPPPPPHRD